MTSRRIGLVLLIAFTALAILVAAFPINAIDVSLSRQLQRLQGADTLFRAASWFGYAPFDIVAPIVSIGALVAVRWRREALFLAVTVAGTWLVYHAVRLVIVRPRPSWPIRIEVAATGPGFPSGHVVNYIALFGGLLVILHARFSASVTRRIASGLLVALLVLVGPSRIYLGDHWTSDVVGGWLLAGGLLVLARDRILIACTLASVLAMRPAAADTTGMPAPGDESGRTDVVDPGDSVARRIGRDALFVPWLVTKIALAPARALVWADDRFTLQDRFYRVFFNADRTIGLYPTATYESPFGLSAGVRFVDHDLFGRREQLELHGSTREVTGTHYSSLAAGSLRSGDRWSGAEVALAASVARRPDDPFYGIGNETMPAATSFRWQEARLAASADLRPAGDLHLVTSGVLTGLRFGRGSTGDPIDELYDPAGLVGFSDGVLQLDSGAELRFDSRRASSVWEAPDVHSAGSLAELSLGRVHRLDGGSDFWRYGVELQHFLRVGDGPRLFSVRFRGDGVSGSLEDVPFLELPSLGGGTFLRGYPLARFRDRVAAVASLTYEWDLSRFTSAYVFSDAGRVFPSLDQITTRDLRVGYGVGLELHTYSRFILEGSVASSIDGGLFFNVSVNPVLDSQPRWR